MEKFTTFHVRSTDWEQDVSIRRSSLARVALHGTVSGVVYLRFRKRNGRRTDVRNALVSACGLLFLAGVAFAESPQVFFDRSQITELRQRITQPQLASLWSRILTDAEAYCDPASSRYVDPENSYPLPERREGVSQSRYRAALVHRIGRKLTKRMEAIGFAYQLTGRPALGRHGAALLLASIEEYPVSNPVISKGFAGGRGDFMRGLAVGYDLLSECLDDAQRRVVAAACADYLDAFVKEFNDPRVWWYRVHNYNGVNGGAAGCLALALSDQYPDRADAWTAECVKIVERWLEAGFDKDGAYLEGVTYSGYGLSNAVMFADALRRHGNRRLFDHPTFQRLPEFYALSLLPGEGVYDARNDSRYSQMNVTLLKLAEGCNSGLYKWLWENSASDESFLRILWDNCVPAVDPAAAGLAAAKHFRGRGLCVWRTGWKQSDVMFSIEAGPYYPVTHNQADKGHFTLYGLGQRWATDPGYANEHNPNGRGQTVGHSCLLVDGRGQALSGAGWGTNGTIVDYVNSPRYGYALADCTEAYCRNNKGLPGAVVEHARRHAFFVYPHHGAPAYAVVMDDIRKDEQTHEFTWQMMFSGQMMVELDEGRAVFEPTAASGHAYVDTPADQRDRGASGACSLDFEVETPDDYTLWARVRTRAKNLAKADSFFLQMDGAQRIAWHMPGSRDWTWKKITSGVEHAPVTYTLGPGKHRLAVQQREPGAQVDCLLLTRDPKAVASLYGLGRNSLLLEAETGRLDAPMRLVQTPKPDTRLVLRIHADSEVDLTTDAFHPSDWHAAAAFPRFRATSQAVNPRYIAVLLPLPVAVEEPRVAFRSGDDQRVVRIEWPGHTDTLTWSTSDGSAAFGDLPVAGGAEH